MMPRGFYRCSECQRTWSSAYADKRFGQLCKECRKYTRPHRVTTKMPVSLSEQKYNGHRSDLCAACIKGKCPLKKSEDHTKQLVASVISSIGL